MMKLLALTIAIAVSVSCDSTSQRAEQSPSGQEIDVSSLNSGDAVLIGKLGYPLGTYHHIKATFGMPVRKGRAGQGGRILLRVLEIDGQEVAEPLWLPYFKSTTLQTYRLPDGTDIFPRHPKTHKLTGKTVVCQVYEDIVLLDVSPFDAFDVNPSDDGFAEPHYKTMLGIIRIK